MPASDYFTISEWLSFSLRHASAGMKTRKKQRYLQRHERCQPAPKGAMRLRRLVNYMHNRRLALAPAFCASFNSAIAACCSGPSSCAGSSPRSSSTPSPSSASPSTYSWLLSASSSVVLLMPAPSNRSRNGRVRHVKDRGFFVVDDHRRPGSRGFSASTRVATPSRALRAGNAPPSETA
jgi:hypothetical protein